MDSSRIATRNPIRLLTAFAVSMLLAVAFLPQAGADVVRLGLSGGMNSQELDLAVGKSDMVVSPQRLKQVVVGDPNIADVRLISSTQVLILGKAPGVTNLAFRNSSEQIIALMDVVVGYDITALKSKLHEVLPQETALEVRSANDSVMLSGEVSSTLAMDTALAVANSFAPKGKVLNLMQIGGGQQVMLEVHVAEISRTSLKNLGVETNITGTSGSEINFGLITGNPLSNAFGSGFSLTETGIFDSLQLKLAALERQGLAHTLAEPNIVALSGQEASFLAGGEFPVPTVQSGSVAGAVTVTFKEFGVGLKFTPTVLSSEKINLKLNTEVSAIDSNTGTTVLGTAVPGVTTRRAGTTIEMGDGQSFAIAGLLQNDITNVVNKFPGLGDIPILGALFRSTDFQRKETELVIVVTPRLVAPTARGTLGLPTDGFVPPNGFDQYLMGRLEGKPPKGQADAKEPAKTAGGVDGEYGHKL